MKGINLFTVIMMLSFLSGCAYMQGIKDQKAAAARPAAKQGSVQVETAAVPAPAVPQANPASTAAKMIAPLTN
jgi:hypothetical protein